MKKFEHITGALAAVALFALMMVTFIDVVGRNVFNRPLHGGSELTEILLAAGIFLLLPTVAFREEHIVVDLIDSFRGRVLIFLEKLLVAVLGGGMFLMIGWRLWILGDMAAGYRDATPSLRIPLAPVLYAMSIMAFITALCFVSVVRNWRRRAGNPELERILKAEGLDLPHAGNDPSAGTGDAPAAGNVSGTGKTRGLTAEN